MSQSEEKIDLASMQAHVQGVYDLWAPEHADGEFLTVRPYADEDYQRIDRINVEPELDLEIAGFLGKTTMGEAAYSKLSAGYEEYGVVGIVMDRHNKAQNTLFPTLHLRNVIDTTLTHNNLYVSSGGDPELGAINDLLSNPMMSRLDVNTEAGSMAVLSALAKSGQIDFALPPQGAKEYGMNKDSRMYLGRRMSEALNARLEDGVAVHWSPPGKRGKRIILEDGSEAMSVGLVHDKIAEIIVGRISLLVPVPMVVRPRGTAVELLPPRRVESIADVHMVMEEMVEVASGLTKENIYYGMPEGAKLAEV